MAPTYTYNEEIGVRALQVMHGATQLIQSELAELDSYLRQNLAEWIGKAENAYGVHKQAWDAAAKAMNTDLENAGVALARINEGYGEADAYAMRMWGHT